MWEWVGGSLVYSVVKDAWLAIRSRKRRLSPERVVELRQRKKEIEPILWERAQRKLGLDVIIRDVKRLDEYPHDTDANRKGISAWFKVGLSSTYHNGIEVNLGWYGLVKSGSGWRLEKPHGEEGSVLGSTRCVPSEAILTTVLAGCRAAARSVSLILAPCA